MVRIAAVFACVLAMPASAAHAATAADIAARWQPEAAAYWKAAPNCPGGITWNDMPDTFLPGHSGAATIGGCEAWLRVHSFPNYQQPTAWFACYIVAHEYGHLLGLDHDDAFTAADPNGVMTTDTSVLKLPRSCVPERRLYEDAIDRRWCRKHRAKCAQNYPKLAQRVANEPRRAKRPR